MKKLKTTKAIVQPFSHSAHLLHSSFLPCIQLLSPMNCQQIHSQLNLLALETGSASESAHKRTQVK